MKYKVAIEELKSVEASPDAQTLWHPSALSFSSKIQDSSFFSSSTEIKE